MTGERPPVTAALSLGARASQLAGMRSYSRRQFLARSARSVVALGSVSLARCGDDDPTIPLRPEDASRSRLTARPITGGTRGPLAPGVSTLATAAPQEMLLSVPAGYTPSRAAPLAVVLHGAGQSNDSALALLRPFADAVGLLLLAPQATGTTWDFLYGRYGSDVQAIDAALAQVFRDCNVDAGRVALAGFSDGASYALSLGLGNGDLFTRIVAFSPGILNPAALVGRPRLFVSHGRSDQILNIDRASRSFVPAIERAGYAATYVEFDGGHTVPSAIAEQGARFAASFAPD